MWEKPAGSAGLWADPGSSGKGCKDPRVIHPLLVVEQGLTEWAPSVDAGNLGFGMKLLGVLGRSAFLVCDFKVVGERAGREKFRAATESRCP